MEYKEQISSIPDYILKDLIETIEQPLLNAGIFYRVFGRIKSYTSFDKKIKLKSYSESHKVQDIFGVRITVYFKDDVDICQQIMRSSFIIDEENTHIDKEEEDVFKPTMMNLVCKLPDNVKNNLEKELFSDIIDDTFELQIRTVFSEGWHEVEHDLKYKCKNEWEDELGSSRALNGIYATVVTCDWSIIRLFDERAYHKYKAEKWESMVKNKFRIKFTNTHITNPAFCNKKFMKNIYKLNREELIISLIKIRLPLTIDNFLYIANELFICDESITTPHIIRKSIEHSNIKVPDQKIDYATSAL